ncbi:hypothetical protein NUW58_g10111 [Xylaria curta]|uniref:Uncharacterized protein n=1 Tax=Xylaria curta TaxID=42375 RepID=A0ACC1MQ30_9PEZI|nr:hypothetical protein NUW58_g10111 [Xylaria curta]
MITGLHHINLVVPPDTLDDAAAFYGSTLGLTPRAVPALQNESNRPHQHNAQNASNQMFGAIGGAGPSGSAGGGGPVFGGPLQDNIRPGHSVPFGGGAAVAMATSNPPVPAGSAGTNGALQQGQQPILNDALSYLDQVKVQFADQPDVYNKFLDIMKDFKSQT